MYICIDNQYRIVGMNINNMSGNTGWAAMPENKTGKTEAELFARLFDGNGVPLYKMEHGEMVCRTAEEVAADVAAIPVAYDEKADMQAALDLLGVTVDG